MAFTIWTQDGSNVGPLNTESDERTFLTIRNDGVNPIWLAPSIADSVNGPLQPPDYDTPYNNAPIAKGETITIAVEPGELYYYGASAGLGSASVNVRVWAA